jgi:hypothetical protein
VPVDECEDDEGDERGDEPGYGDGDGLEAR